MADNKQIFDIEEAIKIIVLSQDLRAGKDVQPDTLTRALYEKLAYDVSDDFVAVLEEFLDEINEEINAIANTLRTRGATTIEDMKQTLLADQDAASFVIALAKTKEEIEAAQNEGIDEYNIELVTKILRWVTLTNRIRVQKDVVPLIQRGMLSTNIREAIEFWDSHKDIDGRSEKVWQGEFAARIEILQRTLGGHLVLLHNHANVGGKKLDGKGELITDYLFLNGITQEIVLVEIKTPDTPLLGTKYRSGYPLSKDVSGSVSQILHQRHNLMTNFHSKLHKSKMSFEVNAPRCIVIVGRMDKLQQSADKLRSFEMQRQALAAHVQIMTFDELYKEFSTFHMASSLAALN